MRLTSYYLVDPNPVNSNAVKDENVKYMRTLKKYVVNKIVFIFMRK